jgi:Ca2+-binding RTX toxin-like protein
VTRYFNNDGQSSYAVEEIQFADGTVWDVDTVKQLATQGSSGKDTLYGYTQGDEIRGGQGDDTIYGLGGNDTLYGDEGNDYLYGDVGDDTLHGGAGNDNLNGDDGNDTLYGGEGNDSLTGGAGSDTYYFERGWGQDTLNNNDTSTNKKDIIRFGEGISASDISVTRYYNSYWGNNELILTHSNGDKVTVTRYFNNDGQSSYAVEEIQFADGTVWDVDTVKQLALQGSNGKDTLYGYAQGDEIRGGQGDDTIYGLVGNDTLYGDEGNDNLYGDVGDDTLHGGAGNDNLNGDAGNDVLYGGEGSDTLNGGDGNDWLEGGAGNDSLTGGAGSDTYYFESGWGQDVINNNDTSTGKKDVIRFGEGISASDISVTRYYNSYWGNNELILTHSNGDKITVTRYFNNDGQSSYAVEEIQFADGTVWNVDTVKQLALQGSNGNDTIYGYASDDELNGGAGNDTLNGGAGNDTYYFDKGWGQDNVTDNDATAGNSDKFLFGEGIAADQLWFKRSGSNLEVSLIGTSDKITISGWYNGDAYHIEQMQTSSGQTLAHTQIDALVSAMAAFAPPAAGQTSLTQEQQAALAPVIAANWQ